MITAQVLFVRSFFVGLSGSRSERATLVTWSSFAKGAVLPDLERFREIYQAGIQTALRRNFTVCFAGAEPQRPIFMRILVTHSEAPPHTF